MNPKLFISNPDPTVEKVPHIFLCTVRSDMDPRRLENSAPDMDPKLSRNFGPYPDRNYLFSNPDPTFEKVSHSFIILLGRIQI